MPENELSEATWTTAYVNGLPDSSFALILPGGEKDEDGKTTPRSLRKLPYKDADGAVDLAHLRNALARAPQMTGVSEEQRAKALRVLQAAAKKHLASYQKELEVVTLALLLVESYGEPEPEEEGDVEAAEAELAESASGHVLALAERAAGLIVPLHLDVALIRPGGGNKRDNHYYPRDVIERDSGVFAGVKMYETDHRPDEKSTRTWVSTVKEIVGYTDDGAPIGRVSVHDRNFAERLMALSADDLLEKMECSILAAGTARKGKVDGRAGHIVEAITSAESVDWVTRAGAGGRALSLAESHHGGESMEEERTDAIEEQETDPAGSPVEEPLEEVTLQEQQPADDAGEPEEPPAPAMLDPEKVREVVDASSLPDVSKAKLSEASYADEEAVAEAVQAELAYIKEVTGSGKPFAQGGGTAPERRPRTAQEANADFQRILTEVGMPYLGGR